MASSANDSTLRPLQHAMRLVKTAIQLDVSNRCKVNDFAIYNAGHLFINTVSIYNQ